MRSSYQEKKKTYFLYHGSVCPCDLVFAPSFYTLLDFLLGKPCPEVKCAGKSIVVKIQRLLFTETSPAITVAQCNSRTKLDDV